MYYVVFLNSLLTVLNHSWCLQVSERGHISLSTVVKLLKHKVILEGTAFVSSYNSSFWKPLDCLCTHWLN